MKQEKYVIKDKEYSRDALIEYGRNARPGVFWIPRMLGIIFMGAGLIIMALIGITMLILNATGVFSEPDFPVWVFFIPLGVFGLYTLVGLLLFIFSFVGHTEERYIKYAIRYLNKHHKTLCNSDQERLLSPRDVRTLERYDRLLKGGAISQEEYDRKKKEILG
jgi:hypothetical protein